MKKATKQLKRYCLGFLFSEDRQRVLLINKEHPDWQKGRWWMRNHRQHSRERGPSQGKGGRGVKMWGNTLAEDVYSYDN